MPGDALRPETFASAIAPADTLVHLVGTPRPSPVKGAEFRAVDLPSVHAAVEAALLAGVRHFVYVSVAHPAPIMRDYIAVRREGERLIRESGIPATILRPWYVLGPATAGPTPSCRSTRCWRACRPPEKVHGVWAWSPRNRCFARSCARSRSLRPARA